MKKDYILVFYCYSEESCKYLFEFPLLYTKYSNLIIFNVNLKYKERGIENKLAVGIRSLACEFTLKNEGLSFVVIKLTTNDNQ